MLSFQGFFGSRRPPFIHCPPGKKIQGYTPLPIDQILILEGNPESINYEGSVWWFLFWQFFNVGKAPSPPGEVPTLSFLGHRQLQGKPKTAKEAQAGIQAKINDPETTISLG